VLTRYRFVRMHTNTPTSMPPPGHVSGAFALECAMDELAVQLGMDPMQLRILNHADRNEADELPWSSKELLACYRTAAERFGCAVRAACETVRGELGADGAAYAEALRRRGLDHIEATADAEPGDESERFSSYAFGAVFVEVRIDPDLGMIRVPRIIGAYDVGCVVNPKIARSQCIGGMVGGLGMALLERADWDARFGRVMNGNLAEYLVPVH